eukprot:scaffold2818_cov59-Cylindrotheca_fusiformis.AAC.3
MKRSYDQYNNDHDRARRDPRHGGGRTRPRFGSSSGAGYSGPASRSGSHERFHCGGGRGGRGGSDGRFHLGGGRGGRGGSDGRFHLGGGRGGRGGRLYYGREHDCRGGPERGHDLERLSSCTTNMVPAEATEGFQFFLYTVNIKESNGEQMESRHRRKELFDIGFWDNLLKGLPNAEKKDLRRAVYFSGSYFCSGRPIPGLEQEKLPVSLPLGKAGELGETVEIVQLLILGAPIAQDASLIRAHCYSIGEFHVLSNPSSFFIILILCVLTSNSRDAGHSPVYVPDSKSPTSPIPSTLPVFVSYINGVLQRALSERLSRWDNEYIVPDSFKKITKKRREKGKVVEKVVARVYRAYTAKFGVIKKTSDGGDGKVQLALTVDLRAKVMRTVSVLDDLAGGKPENKESYEPEEIETAKEIWIKQVVICMHDKKCYSVTDLLFDHSPSSLPVEGLGVYHSEYFKGKGVPLKYPHAKPMVAVLGRRNRTIYFPPELVAGNVLELDVKEELPRLASYEPKDRHEAVDKIRSYLIPGAQKTKDAGGLLPALGIQMSNCRISAKATVLPLPMMKAAGVKVPADKKKNWAPILNRANFNVNPGQANTLNAVVIYHEALEEAPAKGVFLRIRDFVNKWNATYRLSQEPVRMVRAGESEKHWEQVERTFSDPSLNAQNIFVLDFVKQEPSHKAQAYPVVKQMLTKHGYISQFVNFNTYAHHHPEEKQKSDIILRGVARQILQKAGARLWWVNIPRELPTPTVFVGVDVFHAPRVYDPIARKRTAKASCAAIIVQVYRSTSNENATVELYSEAYARKAGKEYDLRDALKTTISTALKELKCDPRSCIVWRDGIGESAFTSDAPDEIQGITEGLNSTPAGEVPLAYVVCQKRIDTKLFTKGISGRRDSAPSGTLVEDIQGLTNHTFYINGSAPPRSTAKPVRFIVIRKDDELKQVSLPHLTWDMCHDYPNWTGPIKVPSVCQMAHKLAELAGNMADCGRNINNKALKNKVHFL